MVGDGGTKDVAREVKQGFVAGTDLLDVGNPADVPDWLATCCETSIDKGVPDPLAESFCESKTRDRKGALTRETPGILVRAKPAGRKQHVYVGMVKQSARPSVKNRENGSTAADENRIPYNVE